MTPPQHILFECGICGCYHPWEWNGDCRDDDYRTFPDKYAEALGIDEYGDIEIRTWEERVEADNA